MTNSYNKLFFLLSIENMLPEIDDSNSPLLDKIIQDEIIIKGGGGFDASGRHSTFRYTVVSKF